MPRHCWTHAASLRLSVTQQDAIGLLALIAGQDVEPGESPGSWKIAKKVAKDRVISTVDTEARHGHKSTAVRTDGFKAHLAAEPDTGIVTAIKVTPANHPDGPVGVALMVGEPDGLEVLADSAYGSGSDEERARGVPPPPRHQAPPVAPGRPWRVRPRRLRRRPRRPHCHLPGRAHRSALGRGSREVRAALSTCPLKARCTKASARSFTVSEHDAELVAARVAWRDEELRATYRTHRPMAERAISWLVAKGNRRFRYRGVERNEAWAHRRVAAFNLRKLVAARAHARRRELGARKRRNGPSGAS